jgi:hypothetical protein
VSTTEAACFSTPEELGLRVEPLPFTSAAPIRALSRLPARPRRAAALYPSAVRFHHELAARVPEVLAAHKTNRRQLCDARRNEPEVEA